MTSEREEKVAYDDELRSGLQLEAGRAYRIEVRPRPGKLHAQLFDESGEHILAQVDYEGTGEHDTDIKGTTDGDGVLLHWDVPMEDFTLTIAGEFETVVPAIPVAATQPHQQIVEGYYVTEEPEDEAFEEADVLILPGADPDAVPDEPVLEEEFADTGEPSDNGA